MKRSPSTICTKSVAALLAISSVSIGLAAEQTYDATNVNNVWDLTTQNWDGSAALWTNGNNAIFGDTGETVELSGGIVVGDITFNSTGYDITDTDDNGTLTLGGPSTITVTNVSDTATISDGISTGSITKEGSGTLTFSGPNTYSGTTTVNAGYLKVLSNTALGDTTGATTVTSTVIGMTTIFGTVVLGNGVTVTGETINLAGSGANFAGALQADSNASAAWAGTVNLDAGARVGAQNGGVLTLSGVIQNGASDTLAIGRETVAGPSGVVLISGTGNTYTGQTQIVRGVLKIGATNALPVGTTLNVDTTAASEDSTFDLNGFNQTVAGLVRGGALSGTGDSFVTNTGGSASTLTVTGASTYSGKIQDGTSAIAVTKSGTGVLVLSGNNNYSGSTSVTAGTLTLSGANTSTGAVSVSNAAILNVENNLGLGSTVGTTSVAAGGQVVLADGIVVSGETIFIAGNGGNNFGALQTAAGKTAEWKGNIVTTADTRLGADTNGTLIISGVISGSNAILFSRGSGATTVLDNVNIYTGDTQIFQNSAGNASTLRIGVDNAISASSRLATISAISSVSARLDLNGHILTLRSLDSSANHAGASFLSVTNDAAATMSTLTLADPAGNTVTFGGILKDGTSGAGGLSLVKNGAFTQILIGNNTYTGSTTVNSGTLQIGGTVSTLGQNGALASTAVTLNGGIFALNNAGASNNNANRISNSAAFTMKGGTFLFSGSDLAATNSSETIGDFVLSAGISKITNSFGGTNVATLTANQFTRPANGGIALVNGLSLGKDTASTASVARILLTTAPTLVGTTAALSTGINSGAQNTAIVPYLLGAVTSTTGGLGTASSTANTFLTYNAGTGLRPLNLTDEFTPNAYTTGNNVRLTTDTPLLASATINSLILENATATISSGQTLTVTSGAILFTTGASMNINGGSLNFGAQEGIVTINSTGNTFISSVIQGSAGVSYYGTGTLVLATQQNTYSGDTLLKVALTIPQSSSAGAPGAPTSGPFGTGTLILGGGAIRSQSGLDVTIHNNVSFDTDTTVVTSSGPDKVLTFTGTVTLKNGDRTLTQNAISNTVFSGEIKDDGNAFGLTIAGTGSGPVVLSGNSTYTGGTRIKAGTLVVSGSLSGSSAVTIGDAASLATPAVLGGGGTVGNVTVGAATGNNGATLQPHAGSVSTSTGSTLHTGSLTLANSSAHLALQLGRTSAFSAGGGNGTAGGDRSDHVSTSGAVTLNGADLQLSLLTGTGYTLANNDVFFLIINGGGAINGTFSSVNGVATNLSEGAAFNVGPQWYSITYLASFSGNTFTGGNDVALMAVVPEPGVLVTLFAGLGALIGLQRFRRRHSA